MDAKEIREIADSVNSNNGTAEMDGIITSIKSAAKVGKYEVFIYLKAISDPVRKQLREKGFNVGATIFDRNEVLTKISWSNE